MSQSFVLSELRRFLHIGLCWVEMCLGRPVVSTGKQDYQPLERLLGWQPEGWGLRAGEFSSLSFGGEPEDTQI